MAKDKIKIVGAKQHNLKNLTVEIPKFKTTVITGLSGSGKSSLAFDTLYAEGQRQYIESLSTYARQFLSNSLTKPDLDYIEGLSPAISIDQKTVSASPRSTVGTITEVYDYLRLLFARVGQPICPKCQEPMSRLASKDELICKIKKQLSRNLAAKYILTVDIDNLEDQILKKKTVIFQGKQIQFNQLGERPDKIFLVLAQVKEDFLSDLIDRKISQAINLGSIFRLWQKKGGKYQQVGLYSTSYTCSQGHFCLDELCPKLFSFNSPSGVCQSCHGLGKKKVIDRKKLIPSPQLTIAEGAIHPWGRKMAGTRELVKQVKSLGIDINKPFSKLKKEETEIILYGKGDYQGAINNLEERYLKTDSDHIRFQMEKYMVEKTCPDCLGDRLNRLALGVKVKGRSIADLARMNLDDLKDFFSGYRTEKEHIKKLIDQIDSRLTFLLKVGVDYLNLNRGADSLAGGEAQRVRLATQLGSALSGIIYILDEPTIGLHPSDLEPLLEVVSSLKDNDSTVVMVEHDQKTIESADHIIDMGPGAGQSGGEIVGQGSSKQIKKADSLTGKYLRKELEIKVPERRRKTSKYIKIIGASHRNLKDIDVKIPLGRFVCISGVSGSGKSTLLYDVLGRALSKHFHRAQAEPGKHKKIEGIDQLDKVIKVNQAPIGRTPRSNPATYVGLFNLIRKEFAQTKLAKKRGYDPAQFSFNVKKGRCSKCAGQGQKKIEMYFMEDVYVPCPKCKGQRYSQETLEVKLNNKYNIAQVLGLTIDQAREFFVSNPKLRRKMEVLQEVGLGYLTLGQPATTLSGGEAQRIKLAKELSKKSYNQTLYILDEPTTGLHIDDINRLLKVLNRLVDRGNSVLVIEHNLEVLKSADYIIDLGPGGGDQGGEIVVQGNPEQVVKNKDSLTGKFLKDEL